MVEGEGVKEQEQDRDERTFLERLLFSVSGLSSRTLILNEAERIHDEMTASLRERVADLEKDLDKTHEAWADADCCKHADRLIDELQRESAALRERAEKAEAALLKHQDNCWEWHVELGTKRLRGLAAERDAALARVWELEEAPDPIDTRTWFASSVSAVEGRHPLCRAIAYLESLAGSAPVTVEARVKLLSPPPAAPEEPKRCARKILKHVGRLGLVGAAEVVCGALVHGTRCEAGHEQEEPKPSQPCDRCDPSFGCFDGRSPCYKVELKPCIACGGRPCSDPSHPGYAR